MSSLPFYANEVTFTSEIGWHDLDQHRLGMMRKQVCSKTELGRVRRLRRALQKFDPLREAENGQQIVRKNIYINFNYRFFKS